MTLASLAGHHEQRRQVSTAIRGEKLPQLLLVTGPEGVGKQRFGLWVAQRLLCERPSEEPCGECRQCQLVLNLAHPDLHWLVPVLRPKAGEQDKQIDELEEAIGEALEQRRKDPLYGPPEGLAGHFVATSRLINRRAAMRPVEGRNKLFLIGYSERLVPQEASPEAANALLKLLEEPQEGTYFVLCAADVEEVLPTIRSRAVRMRLGRLTDEEVRGFLKHHSVVAGDRELDARVRKARGAIGAALNDSGTEEKAIQAAIALLESARSKSTAGWEVALKQTPFSARGEFTDTLDAMADLLVEATRTAPSSRAGKLSTVPRERLVDALARVGEARELAQSNVNPQLLLAVLNQDLAEVL
jgi:DNA polymerase III delta prime subunit